MLLLPVDPQLSARELARALVEVGSREGGAAVRLLDATGATLARASALRAELEAHPARDERLVVAADALCANEVGIPLAMEADAVVLCVVLGKTDREALEQALALVGPKVLGSALLPAEEW